MDVHNMYIDKKNVFIVKQASGTEWCFLYEDKAIYYKLKNKNSWSEKQLLAKSAYSSFSVILLLDDRIQVFYINLQGNIEISELKYDQWLLYDLLQNKNSDIYELYFKVIHHNLKVHIFYSVLNKKFKINTLLHQTIDESKNLSKPLTIDTLNVEKILPFTLNSTDDDNLYIMYPRYLTYYELGYKILNTETELLSSYITLDKNLTAFSDYHIITLNNFCKSSLTDYDNISFYQEHLISKEKQFNDIEQLLLQKEHKIKLLEEEISTLKTSVNNKNKFFHILFSYLKRFSMFLRKDKLTIRHKHL
jgi:hypothetical protein